MLLNNLFEELARTGKGKAAVVGWGRGMGHKGHMFLASSVITQARESNADPYFVVSRTVGKDDPINPEEKLAIYKKVFPQSGHIFQTATEEMPDLTRVLTKLQGLGYSDVTVVVGADQVNALGYVKNYNGKPNKAGDIPFTFNTLNVISRQETNDPSRDQEGPRATPMRAVLMDPAKSEEEKFAVWRDAMNPELSDEEVMDLMHKAQQRMQAMVKPKKGVAEGEQDPQSELKLINQKLKDAYKHVRNNSSASIGWYMSEVKALKARREELIKQLRQGVSEGVICPHCEADPCICDDSHGFVREERMSAAVRMQRAADRQRAKSDASLRRTPSSIPKPEPKKDEKVAEKIKGADGKACWKGKRYAGTKNGKDICVPVSEDVENIMDSLINKIVVNEAIHNKK